MRRHPTFRYVIVVEGCWYTSIGWVPFIPSFTRCPNIKRWSTYQRVPTFRKALKLLARLIADGLPAKLEVDKKMWARNGAWRKQWCGYKTLTLKSEIAAQ